MGLASAVVSPLLSNTRRRLASDVGVGGGHGSTQEMLSVTAGGPRPPSAGRKAGKLRRTPVAVAVGLPDKPAVAGAEGRLRDAE